jgi:uncharacterized cofD-like protein
VRELDTATDPLLAALEKAWEGPRVVAVGGGHGLAQGLKAIARYAGPITAIVTAADDGGSSGRLAPVLGIPPPGDLRRCLVALTPDDSPLRRLFEHRFDGGELAGHSLGNLMIASLAASEGGIVPGLHAAGRILGAVGVAVPAAPEPLRLTAVVDGSRVEGQVAVTLQRGVIERLTVEPTSAEATPEAVEAILEADQIVLGPGSLYTSVMAALVVPGIVEAVNRSPARLVFVANLVTQDGETLGMDGADHLHALLELTGIRQPSTIVANTGAVRTDPPLQPVTVDPEVVETYGVDVALADVVDPTVHWPQHDAARLGGVLGRLVPDTPER